MGLTDYEIREEVDTFMFEGHDTTSSGNYDCMTSGIAAQYYIHQKVPYVGIAWTLYNLAKHPEHQEKCREEVDAIFDQKGAIEWEDLKSLVYLKYCIKESLRLFPPVPIIGRCLDKDSEVDGRVMPQGTYVFCHTYAIHHNSEVWENPEVSEHAPELNMYQINMLDHFGFPVGF